MLKYLMPFLLLGLLACGGDPLEVQEYDIEESASADGLNALQPAAPGDNWSDDDGVLTATAPATLELLPDHGELTLAFSFRTDADTRAKLLLGGTHGLSLPELALDTAAAPRTPVSVSPGVWQNLNVTYVPATETDPALLVAVYLNNNLIYYQQPLPAAGGETGGLTLEVEAGTLSLTNLRSLDRAGRSSTLTSDGKVELNLPLIRYAYYTVEGNPVDFTDFDGQEPVKEGYISRFDIDAIREQTMGYAIRFTSDLDIPKAGEYAFRLRSPSSARLFIDDELVVDLGGKHQGIDGEGSVALGEGSHTVRLDHYQTSGWNFLKVKAGLSGEGQPASFNDIPEDRAVARLRSGDPEPIETDDRPYLLRSFLNFPPSRIYDYTDKRTHVISVGEAAGPHYSYDLQGASLLQVWRGPFVDVGDMWIDRGEPQVVHALAPVVGFDGRPQWSRDLESWPEKTSEFRHLRYELDEAGRPTFYYAAPGHGELSDQMVPADGGLRRTLTNGSDSETLYTTVVSAGGIRQTAPGTFEMVDPGLNVTVDELAAGGLRLLNGEGVQRLVAELPPGEHLTYTMNW